MRTGIVTEGYAIVVCDKGFIYVGEVRCDERWCIVENAHNIRAWGTSKGLGQLALDGPTDKTKLDACGTIRIPIHSLITLMDTEVVKWQR